MSKSPYEFLPPSPGAESRGHRAERAPTDDSVDSVVVDELRRTYPWAVLLYIAGYLSSAGLAVCGVFGALLVEKVSGLYAVILAIVCCLIALMNAYYSRFVYRYAVAIKALDHFSSFHELELSLAANCEVWRMSSVVMLIGLILNILTIGAQLVSGAVLGVR